MPNPLKIPSAAALLLLAACAGGNSPTGASPQFELVDVSQRLDAASVNAHTYGSFTIAFAGGATTILSGPANFPGNPPGGPGTCDNGLWINSKGKRTAGNLTRPHPHCITQGTAMTVVLEPISSRASNPAVACEPGRDCQFLYFTDPKLGDLDVIYRTGGIKGGMASTTGTGTIVAYAIDAATLNGANRRVGTLTFDLSQYNEPGVNLFGDCTVGLDDVACLPRLITATYEPLVVGGVGQTAEVTGFLWWAPATSPYNY